MSNENFIALLAEFAKNKNIDRPTVIKMLKGSLQKGIEKKFGSSSNFDIVVDQQKGTLQIWRKRVIVADDDPTHDEPQKISLTEAKKIEKDFEVGEEVVEEVDNSTLFDRRTVIGALNVFVEKEKNLEQQQLEAHYKPLLGKIITAEVSYSSPRKDFVILHDRQKNELILPRRGQIAREHLQPEQTVRVLVEEVVTRDDCATIYVSRNSPTFIRELLTITVPEILDNTVQIKRIARSPGYKTKVIVATQYDLIDPAGSCIGTNASRIKIIRENLGHERIEIISHTNNLATLVKRIVGTEDSITIKEEGESIIVYPKVDQVEILQKNMPFLRELLERRIESVLPTTHAGKVIRHSTAAEEGDIDSLIGQIDTFTLQVLKKAGFSTQESIRNTRPEILIEETDITPEEAKKLYQIVSQK